MKRPQIGSILIRSIIIFIIATIIGGFYFFHINGEPISDGVILYLMGLFSITFGIGVLCIPSIPMLAVGIYLNYKFKLNYLGLLLVWLIVYGILALGLSFVISRTEEVGFDFMHDFSGFPIGGLISILLVNIIQDKREGIQPSKNRNQREELILDDIHLEK